MDNKLKRRSKPRLDRRNAIKNIDYEPPSSFSSSELSSSLGTRSLDASPLGYQYQYQTSFRVRGDDGEIDRIVWELGLSGPEDLAISAAAWEARKGRSVSDVLPRSRLHDEFGTSVSVVTDENENVSVTSTSTPTNSSSSSERVGGGGGIKGVRPPLLSPPPPPSLPLPLPLPLPPECSTAWSFPPPDPPDTRGEEDGQSPKELQTNLLLSESCSSSTFNDDDSSSTTTDPMYIISPDARFKRNIKSWIKGALLGSGSFGTVYEGFSDDGFFFAVKEVSLLDQGNRAKQSIFQLEQEISLLSQFEHENIVQYLGTDKDGEKLYIFLELVTKGSLAQLYQKYPLQDSQVSAYTRQILHGLSYLHEREVVHRDIKCANILVDANGSVKLADFGLAKATKLNDVKSCKGTAFWMAPEVVNRKSCGYGLAADIWSLGCTVLEMLTRQLPYSHLECPMQALYCIGKGEPPPVPNSLSKAASDFIQQCLQVKADDRPTAAQLLEHPFVKRPLSASTAPGSPLHHNWRRP